ncbi:MAG: DUF3048 domain-containing protein [Chloroflexota bacterium]
MRYPVMRYVVFALLMTACGLQSNTEDTTPTHTFTSQNTAQNRTINLEIIDRPTVQSDDLPPPNTIGPEAFPENINPLTGMPVDDPARLARLPIVVKISNAPALVRPQAGLSQADVVFEHYAEGGLTRFSAVFYSEAPERVGSIRSARLIDHELVPMFDGMLVFSGASLGVEKYIYGSAYVNDFYAHVEGIEDVFPGAPQPPSEYADRAYKGVLYGPPYFWRDEALPVPHNMFSDLRAIWELAASDGHARRPRLQGMAFRETLPADESGPATHIDIRYRSTRVNWTYDAEDDVYLRTADGTPHTDALTGERITADNVVILFAEHTETEVVESMWQGNPIWSLQIAVWGENDAVLFRDGRRYDGRWTRTIREDIISLRTDSGEMLYLKPGTTWYQVVRAADQQNPEEEWLISE